MNNMQKYDVALMEGVSPKRLAKKRMRAFIEAVSEIAPKALVEAVVDAHNALFEGFEFRLPNGVRGITGARPSGFSHGYGNKTIYNGNDLVRTRSNPRPPTAANTDFHLQTHQQGSFAPVSHGNVVTYDPAPRIDPREPETRITYHPDTSWEEQRMAEAAPPPPPPEELPAPQAVRQHAPQPAPAPAPTPEQPKAECPPVCPEPAPAPTTEVPSKNDAGTPKKEAPKKAAKPYTWNPKDFEAIQSPKCSTTHPFVINLISYSSDEGEMAAKRARSLFNKNIDGVYIYQFDGLAQNTTRRDVWRVRIGHFKSKAAARTYFRKFVHPIVGDQYKWWVGRCDGDKGDKMKDGTFRLAKDITDNDCVDISSQKKSSEQPSSNASSQPAENKQATPKVVTKPGDKPFMDFADEK
ncbi:MAG: SPOR domain-containing protein [Bacteroidaceae bacterium]|nr:SPOR domain-containing protein [Bacteroidaceae bacterium]